MSNYEDQKAAALEHLEKKYGETFSVVSFTARNIDMPYDLYVMKDKADRQFSLTVRYSDEGQRRIQDGYYGVLKADDYQKILRDVLDRYLPDYKLFTVFTASYYEERFDGAFALSEALKENRMQFFSNNYLFVDAETASGTDARVYEQICGELEEYGLTLYLAVYSVSGEQLQNIDEEKEARLYLPEDYRTRPVFEKTIR